MNMLSTQHITKAVTQLPASQKHCQVASPIELNTFNLLIRGDAPLCGAICEPLGVEQTKAIANAIRDHLIQEEVLSDNETVLAHNGLYQYFSLLDQEFRFLSRIQREVSDRLTPRHRFALTTSAVGVSSTALDVIVHTTHRSLLPDDPRAPYYVVPVYILGSQPHEETNYIPSTPALQARVAQLLHADRTEIEVLGIFAQKSFRAWGGEPYEAVIADIVRRAIHTHQPLLFMAGPVSVYLYHDVVSLPDFTEDQWAILNMGEGYLYSQYLEAKDACAKVAHRAAARMNFYSGAGWYAYVGEDQTSSRHAVA